MIAFMRCIHDGVSPQGLNTGDDCDVRWLMAMFLEAVEATHAVVRRMRTLRPGEALAA